MMTPLDILSIETWVLLGTIFGLVSYYIHRKWQYLKSLNIPHDPPSVLQFGHFKNALSPETAFKWDNEQKRKHGPVYGAYTFLTPIICIHDPDILRKIFIKEFATFPNRQYRLTKIMGKELNNGLTAINGSQWKRVRSTMTPTFSTSKLRQMIGIIEWCADNAIEAFNRKLKDEGGRFMAKEIFSRLSLDVVCSAAFSMDVDSQNDTVKEPEIAKQARKLFTASFNTPYIMFVSLFPWFEKYTEKLNMSIFDKSALEYFKNLSSMIIDDRNQDSQSEGRVDLLRLMLQAEIPEDEAKKGAERGITRTEIIGNSMLMILAGYENTGNHMGFLAYNFAQHPKIQEDVQKEIDEIIKKQGKLDYESVNDLKLLDMCINETLRLYFPILRNARIAEKEITIKGITIPRGVGISIPAYALAHDPEYWDEPFEFRPERMEDMSRIDPMVFQPFGAGPRNCIGMRFALMEIKLSMAKILRNFSFATTENTPKPPLKMAFGLSVRAAEDYELKVVQRSQME